MFDINKVLATLPKLAGIVEAYAVTSFECYRDADDHRGQHITVKILDRGPEAGAALRYTATATAENGRTATGNPAGTPEEALRIVHWYKLDEST